MGDDSSRSFVQSLKNEWALLWEVFSEEETDESHKDAFETGKLDILGPEQIRDMTKALSEGRRKLNQKLETVNKELDSNAAQLEQLRAQGKSDEDTVKRINELNDLGQSVSDALVRLDERLKMARQREEELREEAEV